MIFIGLFLCWAIGVALTSLLWPSAPRSSLQCLLVASLGVGAGFGVGSSIYFLCLTCFGPSLTALVSVLAVTLVALVVANLVWKRPAWNADWSSGPRAPWWVLALLLLALALGFAILTTSSFAEPHGEWDSWSIWNLRARFLFREGPAWRDAFSPQLSWSHPDYPPLLPGAIALTWRIADKESTLAPIAVAYLFTFAAVGVVIGAIGILRGRLQAWVAGIALLGTAAFMRHGAMQYADIPLSYFIVAALALLSLQDRFPQQRSFSALAGLMAGFAAWTKNEGLMFVAAVIVARIFAAARFGKVAEFRRQAIALASGLAPPLAIVAYFKFSVAPPNDLMSNIPHIGAKLLDFSRYLDVTMAFAQQAFLLGGFIVPGLLVFAAYWYLVRFKVAADEKVTAATLLGAIALMLAGDFSVYVLLTNDLSWQLTTSLTRVLLQLWPAGLLAFFFAASPPILFTEKAPAKAPDRHKPGRKHAKA